ncbi:MAG: glutathione-disulfide reductase [Legionellaceae bacterium]|nr:glutathione-disulfide reductase [Legionellaceae bacterium]
MQYDLIILGAGSGGMASAVRAAQYGARVAVVESHHPGGTCVNLGCVPKKVMYNAASIAHHMHKAADYGYQTVDIQLDWPTLVTRREAYIHHLRSLYLRRFEHENMTLLRGTGRLIKAGVVAVDGQEYHAPHIVIATGGEPVMPDTIAGIEHAIDSDGFFALQQQPEKVAIIGSGYIGVELACLLNGLGSEVHLLMRGSSPLRRFDAMLRSTLMEIMQQQHIQIHPEHQAKAIALQTDGRKSIQCTRHSVLRDFDAVIVAVGRQARTKELNLEASGIHCDTQGLIRVDAWQNTSVQGIYAIGDVTNAPALTPVAIAAGRRLCDRLFGGQADAKLDYDSICTVVFTHPPIATVGLTEVQARETYGEDAIRIYQSRFHPMFDALSLHKTPTVMKLITQGIEERIVGLHMIGYHADEILQGFGVALKMGATKKDFDHTVAIHPTSAEELVTMT